MQQWVMPLLMPLPSLKNSTFKGLWRDIALYCPHFDHALSLKSRLIAAFCWQLLFIFKFVITNLKDNNYHNAVISNDTSWAIFGRFSARNESYVITKNCYCVR